MQKLQNLIREAIITESSLEATFDGFWKGNNKVEITDGIQVVFDRAVGQYDVLLEVEGGTVTAAEMAEALEGADGEETTSHEVVNSVMEFIVTFIENVEPKKVRFEDTSEHSGHFAALAKFYNAKDSGYTAIASNNAIEFTQN